MIIYPRCRKHIHWAGTRRGLGWGLTTTQATYAPADVLDSGYVDAQIEMWYPYQVPALNVARHKPIMSHQAQLDDICSMGNCTTGQCRQFQWSGTRLVFDPRYNFLEDVSLDTSILSRNLSHHLNVGFPCFRLIFASNQRLPLKCCWIAICTFLDCYKIRVYTDPGQSRELDKLW